MKIYYFAAVAHVSFWGWGEHPSLSAPLTANERDLGGLRGAEFLGWMISLPRGALTLLFFAAAHGKTSRGAAEVWGKGKQSCGSPGRVGRGPVEPRRRFSPPWGFHSPEGSRKGAPGKPLNDAAALGGGAGAPCRAEALNFSASSGTSTKPGSNSSSPHRSSTSRAPWINSTRQSNWRRCVPSPSGSRNCLFFF